MAKTGALFNGPIEVMDTASGKQIALLLSDVFFDGNQIKAQGAVYNANKTIFDAFLGHLAVTGAIAPAPVAPSKPVMVIRAKTPGSMGNFIQAEFKNFDNSVPATPKFDATTTETDTYTGLKPDTIQTVLGSTAINGSKPGLVFAPGGAPAANAVPKAGTYSLAVVNPATAAAVDIPLNVGNGTAFKLQAKADGADGALTKVVIKDVDTGASTFTLVATWKKDTQAKIDAAAVGTTFAYEIEVAPPEGVASVGAPAPGVVTLNGGADTAAAVKASATVSG